MSSENNRFASGRGSMTMIAAIAFLGLVSIVQVLMSEPVLELDFFSLMREDINKVERFDNLLDQTVRLLLPPQEAQDYISKYPGSEFKFYVYDNLPENITHRAIQQCIYDNQKSWFKGDQELFIKEYCAFGAQICTPNHTQNPQDSTYVKRRTNINADTVLAQIFSEYHGPLRTHDPEEASLFIVPYATGGHCECAQFRCKYFRSGENTEPQQFISSLKYLNSSNPISLQKHLFLDSGNYMFDALKINTLVARIEPPVKQFIAETRQRGRGHITIPYSNSIIDYQPISLMKHTMHPKSIALSVVMSTQISGNGQVRVDFVSQSSQGLLFGEASNMTLGGLPVHINDMTSSRALTDEVDVMKLYQRSIFCPVFRGDGPTQKRFFDAIVNGCLPVVLEYQSFVPGHTSHFCPGADPIELVYPFAVGGFLGPYFNNMGIDYSQFVVTVDGTCGVSCIPTTLESLMKNSTALQKKQQSMARYAQLLTYGMEQNMLQYPDAVSAILVKARHLSHNYLFRFLG